MIPTVMVANPLLAPVRTATHEPQACRHSMVPRDVWCGDLRCYRCVYCGIPDWRPTLASAAALRAVADT